MTKRREPVLYRLALARRWNRTDANSVRYRLWRLASDRHPWWDWGHRVMTLVGENNSGNFDSPELRTVWYRQGQTVRMWRTGYQTHPPRSYEIIDNYRDFRGATRHLDENSDEHHEWRAISTSQDGDLHLGRQFWGGDFYGLDQWETELLRRHLNRERRRNWFGFRSWLYSQALESAVNRRKPFACQKVPPLGSGGYTHWHCELPKRHTGPHRYKSVEWTSAGMVNR